MSDQNQPKSEVVTQPQSQSPVKPSKSNPEQEGVDQQTSFARRKAAQSKREIMEQLSRERFPWDE